jgi:hypothetical protein
MNLPPRWVPVALLFTGALGVLVLVATRLLEASW